MLNKRKTKNTEYYKARKETEEAKKEYIKARSDARTQWMYSAIKSVSFALLCLIIVATVLFLFWTAHTYYYYNKAVKDAVSAAEARFNCLQFVTSLLSICVGGYGLYLSWNSSKEASKLWRDMKQAFVNSTEPKLQGRVYGRHEEISE